ncbi:MAG: J domain-containing protein [Clostridiales bacterium]|nr:J domain-containing protein [Clostridiales bacterium]
MDKKYYDLLGVSEDAKKDVIDNAYNKLLIRARHDDSIDMQTINDAYDHLTGNVKPVVTEHEKSRREKAVKRTGAMPFYIIGGIILAVVLILVLPSIFTKTPDLAVTFVGGYSINDEATILENKIEDLGIKNVEVTRIFLDANASSAEADYAGRLALGGMLQSNEGDLLITTKQAFNYLLIDDATLMVLSQSILADLGIELNSNRLVYQNGIPYGIDVSDISLVTDAVSGNGETIICIANSSEHFDEVIMAIKLIFE